MMTLYTDGSCSGNPGRGAFAFIEVSNDEVVHEEAYPSSGDTTNNVMEMLAMLSALVYVTNKKARQCTIYSDSRYVLKGLTEWIEKWRKDGWKTSSGKPVANVGIWIQLGIFYDSLIQSGCGISLVHINSHKGNKWNDYVDKVAKKSVNRERS